MQIKDRLEQLVSPEARQMLGVWYSTADLPTAVLSAVGVPTFLRPISDTEWELTCPFWTFQLGENENFEERLLTKVTELTAHLATAFAPMEKRAIN